MKKLLFVFSFVLSLAIACSSCTKPDSGSEGNQDTPPVTEDKEEQKDEWTYKNILRDNNQGFFKPKNNIKPPK